MAQFDSIRFQPSRPLLKELSADRLNSIMAEIRKNRPRGERGITVRQSGDGTYIGLAATLAKKGGGAPAERKPWDIYVTNLEEGTYTLKVRPGTISRMLPSNWNDEFTAAGTGLFYGIVTATTDGRTITGATISIEETAPEPSEALKFAIPEEVKFVFGIFKEGSSHNAVGGNIGVNGDIVMVASADPAALPGESPYDLYYRLQ
jgi:hypothetical protein